MTATFRRPRVSRRPSYTVLEWRQTWHILEGSHYREAVVRRADGELRLFWIRDDAEVAA